MTSPVMHTYVQQVVKNLVASIEGPASSVSPQLFYPGETVQIRVAVDNGNLSQFFSSIKAEVKGTSGVQSDGALPSMHPLFSHFVTFDLSRPSKSSIASSNLPQFVGCDCRAKAKIPLPQTLSIINKDGYSREAQEGGFVVAYSVEIVARKKGIGKPIRIVLPLTIGTPQPFGPSVFVAPTLDFAQRAWAALGPWVWRTSTLVDLRPQLGLDFPEVTQAEIAYHFTVLPTRVLFRWRVTLTPRAGGDLPILLQYLAPANVDVFLARRTVPLLSDRQGGGAGNGKAYRTDLSDEPQKTGTASLVSTDDGPCARLEGSFDLPPRTIAIVRSCNAELQHLLVASITTPLFAHPLNVHTQLHKPFGEMGPLSVASNPKGKPRLQDTEAGPVPTFKVSFS